MVLYFLLLIDKGFIYCVVYLKGNMDKDLIYNNLFMAVPRNGYNMGSKIFQYQFSIT